MKKTYIPLILLMNAVVLYAGSITGVIIDQVTKEPLIGVSVSVMDTELGAATDANGRYTIETIPPGVYRLEIDYLGYESIIKTDINVLAGKPTVVNARLKEQAIQTEGVEVRSSYFEETLNATMSSVSLSREEIRRYPGGFEDVVRTVSTLPGIAVNNDGGRNDLLVRGGGPSENLYVINGIEVPNINHFGTQGFSSGSLSFINLDFVQNVEFSSGGFSPRYGDKLSSVLTLDLSQGRRDSFGGKALISATQFGLNLEGPIGSHGDFLFSIRRSYLDLLFKALGQPFIPVYSDINLIANYDLPNDDKIFIMSLTAIDNVERSLDTEEERTINAGILDNTQYQFVNGLSYRHLFSSGYWQMVFNVNHNRYQFAQSDTAEITYFQSNAAETEYASGFHLVRHIGKSLNLMTGLGMKVIRNQNRTRFADMIYDLNGNRIPRPAALPGETRVDAFFNKYDFYVQFEWLTQSGLELRLGGRYDRYQALNSADYFSPRFGVIYHIGEDLSIKGSVGRYYQSPSNVWLINVVNRNLKALHNDMYILGVDYRRQGDYRFKLEGYYKSYNDLPTGTITGVNDYIVQTNTGDSYGGREDNFQSFGYYPLVSNGYGKAYGLEFSIQKKLSETPYYGQLSLSYGHSNYTANNGKTYPGLFDQRWIFNFNAGYRFNADWEISGKYRYFTGLPVTPVYRPGDNPLHPGQVENLPEEYLATRIDAGHHLDLRVDRYFFLDQYTIIAFIDVQNVFAFPLPLRPRYDFWADKIVDRSTLTVLPSIGLSVTF